MRCRPGFEVDTRALVEGWRMNRINLFLSSHTSLSHCSSYCFLPTTGMTSYRWTFRCLSFSTWRARPTCRTRAPRSAWLPAAPPRLRWPRWRATSTTAAGCGPCREARVPPCPSRPWLTSCPHYQSEQQTRMTVTWCARSIWQVVLWSCLEKAWPFKRILGQWLDEHMLSAVVFRAQPNPSCLVRCGLDVSSPDWMFVWSVVVLQDQVVGGVSFCGERRGHRQHGSWAFNEGNAHAKL